MCNRIIVFSALTLLVLTALFSCKHNDKKEEAKTDVTSEVKTSVIETSVYIENTKPPIILSDENINAAYPVFDDNYKDYMITNQFNNDIRTTAQPWTLLSKDGTAELTDQFVLETAIQAFNLLLTTDYITDYSLPVTDKGAYIHIDSVQYIFNTLYSNPPDISKYAFGSKYRSDDKYRDYIFVPEHDFKMVSGSIRIVNMARYNSETNELKCHIQREKGLVKLYSLKPIVLNGLLFYRFNAVTDEIRCDYLPEKTTDKISDIRNWDNLGIAEYHPAYLYIKAFLEGDTESLEHYCGVKKGLYDSYKTIVLENYTIERKDNLEYKNATVNGDFFIFSFNVKSSENDVLSAGYHSFYVADGMHIQLIDYANTDSGYITDNMSKAQLFLYTYGKFVSPENYTPDMSYTLTFNILDYLMTTRGKSLFTKNELIEYAEKYLGIKNFAPSEAFIFGDLYRLPLRRGVTTSLRFLSETTSDGIISMKVQYYADISKTIKSELIAFYLQHVDGDYKLLNWEMLKDTGYETLRYMIQ